MVDSSATVAVRLEDVQKTYRTGEVDVHETLKETGRGTSGKHWLRSSLVIAEVATTLVLLVGAGLMIRSFYRLQKVNPGFSYDHLTSFSVALPQKKYANNEQQEQFYNRLLENLRGLPGVEATAAASGLPLGNNGWPSFTMCIVGMAIVSSSPCRLMAPSPQKRRAVPTMMMAANTMNVSERVRSAGSRISKSEPNQRAA